MLTVSGRVFYLLDLLQPLLQRAHGVLLSPQLLQFGDELGGEGRGLDGGHLLGQSVCPLRKTHTKADAFICSLIDAIWWINPLPLPSSQKVCHDSKKKEA